MMKTKNNQLIKKIEELKLLTKISQIINSTLDLEKLLKIVMELVTQMLPVESSSLMLLDKEKNELVFEVAIGEKSKEVKRITFPADKGIAGWVVTNRKPLIVNNVSQDSRFYSEIDTVTHYKSKSILCVPLKIKQRIIGVLEAINKIDGDFTKEDVQLLNTIVNQIAVAVENAQLYKKLEKKVELANQELIHANRLLLLEKDKVKAVIEGMDDGVFATDNSGKVILLNHKSEKLLGKKIGCSLKDLIRDEGFIQAYQEAGRKGRVIEKELSFNLQQIYSVIITPMKEKGKTVGQIAVMRDITKQKEMERLKTNFISVASHELKTPLTSIKSLAEMLLDEELEPQTQKEFTQIINDEADRLARLLGDLMNISKIDSGKRKINKQPLIITDILESVRIRFKELARRNGVIMNFEIEDDCQEIVADKDIIDEIFINLVSNAIKFSPKGGEVKIEVKKIEYEKLPETIKHQLALLPYILISIADTGIGIAKQEMKHLFVDEFFRSERKEVREVSGTGLGLTIVKRLITRLGGDIFVESKIGKGSKFSFVLPVIGGKGVTPSDG
ncbi:MAG: ATP-binding protein [bacterium]